MTSLIHQLKALGDPNRFRISMMLLHRPLCVCELLAVLDIAGGTLSSHLKILKNAGLINQRRDGKWIEYFVADPQAEEFLKDIKQRLRDTREKNQIDSDIKMIDNLTREVCSTSH